MPYYRRWYVAGGTYFFTAVTAQRKHIFSAADARRLLRESIRATRTQQPFAIIATVLLPDHLHTIWSLPSGDADYSSRWKAIKAAL